MKREKRFFVTVRLNPLPGENQQTVIAHTNNTGSMLGLLQPGRPVLLSPAQNPARKLAWTLEAMGLENGPQPNWVGVNTQVPNLFVEAAFHAGLLPQTKGYSNIKREVKHGESRLDALLTGPGLPNLWVECKNVTLVEDDVAAFPDAVTTRGAKHLHTLEELAATGARAAMLYLIQRPDGHCFGPADYIDPEYAKALAKAQKNGVETWPLRVRIDMQGIHFAGEVPFIKS